MIAKMSKLGFLEPRKAQDRGLSGKKKGVPTA